MPKFPGKNVRKKPGQSNNSGNNDTEPSAKKKRKSTTITNDEDSIAVSKQLSKRIRSSGSSRIRTTRSSNKNNDPKICGNGKPMPTLAELEKMYEDSDGESPEEPKSAEKVPLSPKSIKNIASRLLDRITKISDPTDLIDVLPPPPIVPQKKPKKSGIPYIIGCKEREQVIRKPNTSFCKGDDYGLELNAASEDEDSCPKKRQKRSKKVNISKSIFNAKSDEIAERLIENDDSDGSNDSNKTVAYTYYNSPELSGRPQSFSPIPSTSRDNETFLKNAESFNESFVAENGNNVSHNDVELIETSCETIVIDDDSFIQPAKKYDKDSVEIIEPLDEGAFNPILTEEPDSEDLVEIIEPDDVEKTNINNTPIDVDDYYSSIDINQSFDDHDVEVIKIDDLIRENNFIIGKFADKSKFNVITHIEPNIDNPNLGNKIERQTNALSTKETTNDPTIIPETINNSITPPTIDISQTPNRPSEPCNSPSETRNCPSETQNSSSSVRKSPNAAHNSPIEVINNPNAAQKSPRKKHTSAEKRENMMKSIVRNFFHSGESRNIPQQRECTVDLTDDNLPSYRQTPMRHIHSETHKKSLTQLASSLQNGYCLSSSIIANLHNLLQKQQPSTAAPDQTRCNLGSNMSVSSRITKPTAPDEDTPKSSRNFGDCPICMENLGKTLVASTVCGHVFCLKCIQAAIKASGKKCPTCRKHLKGVGYHQLFL